MTDGPRVSYREHLGRRRNTVLRMGTSADHDLALDDGAVDEVWRELSNGLQARMQAEPAVVPQAMRLVLVARYLERIGDHTINVMERLHYMETGRRGALLE